MTPVSYKVWMLWGRKHPAEEGEIVTENASDFYNVITRQSGYHLAPSLPLLICPLELLVEFFFIPLVLSALMSSGWVKLWKLFSRVSGSYISGRLHKVVPCSPTCQNGCLAPERFLSCVCFSCSPQAPQPQAPETPWADEENVVYHLTDEDFDKFIKDHSSVLVMFHAPCEFVFCTLSQILANKTSNDFLRRFHRTQSPGFFCLWWLLNTQGVKCLWSCWLQV